MNCVDQVFMLVFLLILLLYAINRIDMIILHKYPL